MLARAHALGVEGADAELLVDHFLDAELRGARGHGVERLRWLAGAARPSAAAACGWSSGRTAWPATTATARSATWRWCGRWTRSWRGRRPAPGWSSSATASPPDGSATTPQRVAEHGLVCLLTATSTARIMHPQGGPPVVGTNPFCLAFPDRPQPAVIDVSMGTITYGAVLKAAADGQPLPPGAAAEADGEPCTDPDAVTSGDAGILPFGGPQAYKAFGLALAAELLCSSLAGLEGHSAVALLASPGRVAGAPDAPGARRAGGFPASTARRRGRRRSPAAASRSRMTCGPGWVPDSPVAWEGEAVRRVGVRSAWSRCCRSPCWRWPAVAWAGGRPRPWRCSSWLWKPTCCATTVSSSNAFEPVVAVSTLVALLALTPLSVALVDAVRLLARRLRGDALPPVGWRDAAIGVALGVAGFVMLSVVGAGGRPVHRPLRCGPGASRCPRAEM